MTTNLEDIPIPPPLMRTRKYLCTQCYSVFSSYQRDTLCMNCCVHGSKIKRWWKKVKNRKSLVNSILILNIVSKRIKISEVGIIDNISKFIN